jgi:hypothetical protein
MRTIGKSLSKVACNKLSRKYHVNAQKAAVASINTLVVANNQTQARRTTSPHLQPRSKHLPRRNPARAHGIEVATRRPRLPPQLRPQHQSRRRRQKERRWGSVLAVLGGACPIVPALPRRCRLVRGLSHAGQLRNRWVPDFGQLRGATPVEQDR